MIQMLNRCLRVAALLALSGATLNGADETTHLAEAQIAFAPCAENPALDCGTLTVPVDYRRPYGATVDIALIRARATSPKKRIGVIVGNPGGPGVSGVDFVLGLVNAPVAARLREHFDVVSFDPRGVGRSRQVRCSVDAPPFPDDADDATLIRFFDDLSERYARACLEQNGSFVAHVGR
jgi:pimeloyl-ACP methyl ester carboxylesterase